MGHVGRGDAGMGSNGTSGGAYRAMSVVHVIARLGTTSSHASVALASVHAQPQPTPCPLFRVPTTASPLKQPPRTSISLLGRRPSTQCGTTCLSTYPEHPTELGQPAGPPPPQLCPGPAPWLDPSGCTAAAPAP